MFLDEVDDTPMTFQMKLLRVLEDRVVSRLGENAWHGVDFRILAATNRDLGRSAPTAAFGADLYERLAIVRSGCRRCASASTDLPALADPLRAAVLPRGAGRDGAAPGSRARRRPRSRRCARTRGRATSASCAT